MPKLVAVADDGSMKYVGVVTSITGPTPNPEDPSIVTYAVTGQAFPDGPEYPTTFNAIEP